MYSRDYEKSQERKTGRGKKEKRRERERRKEGSEKLNNLEPGLTRIPSGSDLKEFDKKRKRKSEKEKRKRETIHQLQEEDVEANHVAFLGRFEQIYLLLVDRLPIHQFLLDQSTTKKREEMKRGREKEKGKEKPSVDPNYYLNVFSELLKQRNRSQVLLLSSKIKKEREKEKK